MDPIFYVLMFLGGIAVLVYSVEEFVENLIKAAAVLGVSTFILAVIFAGMDFENWAFGIASVEEDLPGVAIGSAIGSALFIVGGALVVGGFTTPFEVEVPKDYLFLMVISPLITLVFLLDEELTRTDGIAILSVFTIIILYIYRKESVGERAYMRDEEVEEVREELEGDNLRWLYPVLMLLFIGGMIIGADIAVRGAEGIVDEYGLNETIFGMTIVGLVISLEEILLVVEPVKKKQENIAAGNIVGSLIFFSTGNIGLLALVKSFSVEESVISFYWPYLLASTFLTAIFLARGSIGKIEALILLSLYSSYWILSYTIV